MENHEVSKSMRSLKSYKKNQFLLFNGLGVLLVLIVDNISLSSRSYGKEGGYDWMALETAVATWPSRPRLAAEQMVHKFGPPTDISNNSVVWYNVGSYKRITVSRTEIPHDFPKPHMDYLEHTISYKVPAEKVDDIVAFDSSITVSRTAGELSARCDLEEHM